MAAGIIVSKRKLIWELCSGSGSWSAPYRNAIDPQTGQPLYNVECYDITSGKDVRLLTKSKRPVHGILAGPPCTHFASSGAWKWKEKGEQALLDGLSVADACCRLVLVHKPAWWCLENPVGRLTHYLGKPAMTFHPSDYGDPWLKFTCLWGEFNHPVKNPVQPTQGSKMLAYPPSANRAALRSVTPPGFAQAFFLANP